MKNTSPWAVRAVSRLLVMVMALVVGLGPVSASYAQAVDPVARGLAARAGAVADSLNAVPLTTGLTKANTAKFRAAVQNGFIHPKVAAIGDSTFRGEAQSGGTARALNSWPAKLAAAWRGYGGQASGENVFGGGGQSIISDVELYDSRVSHTGDGSLQGVGVAGGFAFGATTTGTVKFTTVELSTNIDLYYVQSVGSGVFSYSIDGGAAVNVTATGSAALGKVSLTGLTAAAHTITIAWVSTAPIRIIGYDAWNETFGKSISIHNLGINGATSATLTTGTAPSDRLPSYTGIGYHLAFIEGGMVNDWRTSVPVATSRANLITMINAVSPTADVVICIPVFDNGVLGNTANQQQYIDMMYSVAASMGLPVFDIRKRWISYANAVANGWMVNTDTTHATPAGYQDYASAVVPILNYAAH